MSGLCFSTCHSRRSGGTAIKVCYTDVRPCQAAAAAEAEEKSRVKFKGKRMKVKGFVQQGEALARE